MRMKRPALVAVLAVPLSASLALPSYAAAESGATSSSSAASTASSAAQAAPDDRPRDVIAIEWVRAHAAARRVTGDGRT